MEKWLNNICKMIGIPNEVREEILQFDYRKVEPEIKGLLSNETSENARTILKEKLGPDHRGIKMLGCMLQAMKITQDQYKEKGISKEIFVETMKCFPRFVQEYKVSYGQFGFNLDWWATRHLSMNLFRIGELEYELYTHELEECIGIHIPSDALFTEEKCDQSLEEAKVFFEAFYPEALNRKIYCHSWLLSPALEALLPPNSNILNFQKRFEILSWEKENDSFLEFIFGRKDISLQELPESTTLQRNTKQHLLQGGKVGAGLGVMNWQYI